MLILYSTSNCHLCDEARTILNQFLQTHDYTFQIVEIADDDALIHQYGFRIPVIQCQITGKEIGWPFDINDLKRLLL